jgi:hypothetical protein
VRRANAVGTVEKKAEKFGRIAHVRLDAGRGHPWRAVGLHQRVAHRKSLERIADSPLVLEKHLRLRRVSDIDG